MTTPTELERTHAEKVKDLQEANNRLLEDARALRRALIEEQRSHEADRRIIDLMKEEMLRLRESKDRLADRLVKGEDHGLV